MPALTDSQRRIVELTTLNELAQTLNRALDVREALDAALPHIVELMGLRTGWIFLRDEAGAFRLVARHDLPPAIQYPGPAWTDTCSCQDLCVAGKLNKAVNMVRCSRLKHAVGDKRALAQHASVPLRSDNEVLGILNVATTEFGRFTAPQLQLLSAIGFMVGTAITRAGLHEHGRYPCAAPFPGRRGAAAGAARQPARPDSGARAAAPGGARAPAPRAGARPGARDPGHLPAGQLPQRAGL